MTIPRLSERLQCMQYRRRFEFEIEEIRPDLNLFRNASRELRSSLKFKQILQVSTEVICRTEFNLFLVDCISSWKYVE